MPRILIVTYSQSGQLDEIVSNITSPMAGQAELVVMIPAPLAPMKFDPKEKFDLIILGYPVWFLSPPIPMTSFLKSKEAAMVMKDTPVVTVIGSRNIQEDIKRMIAHNGGNLVGNISLRDRHNNLLSVVTIIYWMGTGKKDKYLGIFPKPGVSDEDIEKAKRFGTPILEALLANNFTGLQDKLIELKAVELDANVVSTENKGKKIFKIWSKLVLKKGDPGNDVQILSTFCYFHRFALGIAGFLSDLPPVLPPNQIKNEIPSIRITQVIGIN